MVKHYAVCATIFLGTQYFNSIMFLFESNASNEVPLDDIFYGGFTYTELSELRQDALHQIRCKWPTLLPLKTGDKLIIKTIPV